MKKIVAVIVTGLCLFFYVALSSGGAQPDGKTIVTRACAACHGIKKVEGTRKDAAAWEKTLDRMIKKGADVKPDERDAVLAYLQTLKK